MTGETRQRTCNILISAVGVLSIPKDPPFDTSKFEGSVVHSGAWDPQLELGGKDVLVVGNGCSAAQLIPVRCCTYKDQRWRPGQRLIGCSSPQAIVDEVGSLTQVARTRQSFLPVPPVPDGALYMWMINWIPGVSLPTTQSACATR